MKKNLLFIIPGLGAGGGEKSLINLLNQMDYSKYNVDLFLLNTEGLFMPFLPKEVNILTHSDDLRIFNSKLNNAIFKFLHKGKFKLAYCRGMFFFKNKFIKNKSVAEQYSWKYLREAIGSINKEYDVAIGYLEKTSNYICVDNVRAHKKIGWIHTEYNKLNVDIKFEEKYFNTLNYLITVSQKCKDALKEMFPNEKYKIKIIENILSENIINKLANEEQDNNLLKKKYINILSVGRLTYEKGFDIAIEACKLLVDKGYKINWNVIGDGDQKEFLLKIIEKHKLEENFKFIGLTHNPYPYIKNHDIYVQPSRFEGKSIAIDEAKILSKPIVVTNFSTVNDQIVNKKEGIIVEMNGEKLSTGIELLIKNCSLKEQLIGNLKLIRLGNEEEINKLYDLIEEVVNKDEKKHIVCNE